MTEKSLSPDRAAFLRDDYCRGFIKYCGFEAVDVCWGRFRSRLVVSEDHRQQDGFIHAGVMAAMADHTAGYSAFTTVPPGVQILTIEFKINFLKPAFGDALLCRSRVIREGRSVIVAESEVFDAREVEESLVAKAMVTLMAIPREKLVRGRQRSPG